jgi:diguanylate cyclase (GGDEF)-like protein
MSRTAWLSRLGTLAVLTIVYVVAGKLCLQLAFLHVSASPVWAPTGLALAAFLALGRWVWPAIAIGAFLVNVTTEGNWATSLAIGVGNMLEGLVGAALLLRFARGVRAFERVRGVFAFTLHAALLAPVISATIGVTSLSLGGFAPWPVFRRIWLTWWLGDAAGALIVAPALLLWWIEPPLAWTRRRVAEVALLIVGLEATGLTVFAGWIPLANPHYPLQFLVYPFLVWAAFRFTAREAATAVMLLSGVAIWGTLSGYGPFVWDTQNESLLLLQAFMGVTAVMTLALAALVVERRHVEQQLQERAVQDSLTGLANYRHLTDVLEAEVDRSSRTGRSFAVLFLDLDNLKIINDRHGHLVGSDALCRLAETLRVSCRAIDTPARFGGDEFAVVMPEADAAAAQALASRIATRLARDGQKPAISASVGIAVYPEDGRTAVELLGAADRLLYEAKAAARAARR